MELYMIESCCEETNEVFWDVVPGESPGEALEEWEKVRGEYATCCLDEPMLLSKWNTFISEAVAANASLTVDQGVKQWEQWKKDIGYEPEDDDDASEQL